MTKKERAKLTAELKGLTDRIAKLNGEMAVKEAYIEGLNKRKQQLEMILSRANG